MAGSGACQLRLPSLFPCAGFLRRLFLWRFLCGRTCLAVRFRSGYRRLRDGQQHLALVQAAFRSPLAFGRCSRLRCALCGRRSRRGRRLFRRRLRGGLFGLRRTQPATRIFVEINVADLDTPESLTCYGPDGEGFSVDSTKIEEPGKFLPSVACDIDHRGGATDARDRWASLRRERP